MNLRDVPIQRKLMTVLLLTSGTMLLLICGAFITYEVVVLHNGMVRGLVSRAQIIAANSTAALAFQNEADATDVLATLNNDPQMVAGGIYDGNGRLFARYPTNAPSEAFPTTPPEAGHEFEPEHLVVFCPVTQGDRNLGTVYLKSDLSVLNERYRAYGWLALVIVVSSILLAYLISQVLQRQISRPILALAETARAISERRDFSVRAKKLGNDEIGLFTDAFNQMLLRIQEQNAELQDGEARVRAVLNSALSAVVVIDAHGRVTDWNPRAETMFGWSRPEAIGRDLSETIIPPRHREGHRRGMKHYLATGEGPVLNQMIELSALRKDGREFPVELSISPIKSGDVVTFCGFITDITERKKAETEIRELNAKLEQRVAERTAELADERKLLRTLIDNLPDYIYGKDTQGRLFVDNIAHMRMLDASRPEEVMGKTVFDYFPRQLAEKFFADEQAVIHSGESLVNRREQHISPDGSVREMLTTKVPIHDQHGKVAGFVGITRDITELIRVQEDLRQAKDAAEAVNKELEAFSYSVSHDLRAPLRHINGFVELLNQTSLSSLDDSGKRYLGIISDAAKQMGTLIDDLLVFSRMGRSEMRRVPVKMGELVAEVMREMEHDLAGRNIAWDIGPLPEVVGDRPMLKQVWVNLLSNAVKYSRPREQAVIKVASRKNDHGDWEFSVRDNGAGFDMQYAGKLFGVFQRLHHAEEFEGTGIGLANVQRIVLRHGGRVWAEGKVDAGATFYFTFPDINKEKI